ncbi:MAG: S-layer homology domain-containing protein [Firmicutes bacterium]|nr:S-layer homology domain-containing protein [Bacillota bacterium]
MRTMRKRVIALLLTMTMLISAFPVAAFAQGTSAGVTPGRNGQFIITDEEGNTESIDNSVYAEDYPYGIFALQDSQLWLTEGDTTVLKVYRLGGTTNKASAILTYYPAIVQGEDGEIDESYAIRPEDITIEVEDPQPITAYQPWGEPEAPEASGVAVSCEPGFDGNDEACMILQPALEGDADSYQWLALVDGEWVEVKDSDSKKLPVAEEELQEYDFRCVYTVDGVSYSTDCLSGDAYVKEEAEELPEMPDNMPLNPEKTFSQLPLEEGKGVMFEVCFADGEYVKEIRITANDNDTYDFDRMAAITIEDCIGGQVHQSLNTLLLRIEDNDADEAVPTELGFAIDSVRADKAEGTVVVTVKRTAGQLPVSVDWHTEDGTAKEGVDYAYAEGTVSFYKNATAEIEIPLINDGVEDLEGVEFDIVLENLLGDDAGEITDDRCSVYLFNTAVVPEGGLNLESILYDADAVDATATVTTEKGVSVASPAVTDTAQVTEEDDQLATLEGSAASIQWLSQDEMEELQYSYANDQYGTVYGGRIYWGSNVGSNKMRVTLSHSGCGGGSDTKSIKNMHGRYTGYSATIHGAAGLSSLWYRMWHGDMEFAYTYFSDSDGKYWDNYKGFDDGTFEVSVRYAKTMYASSSFAFDSYSDGSVTLGLKKWEGGESEDTLNISAEVDFTKRTFSKPFYINVHTANDSDTANGAAELIPELYNKMIKSVTVNNDGVGGVYSGMLIEGSTVVIELGETLYTLAGASISDSDGKTLIGATVSGDGRKATFSNILLDPSKTYTFELVLMRNQKIKLDLLTSAEIDEYGNSNDAMIAAAYDLFKSRVQGGKITVANNSRLAGLSNYALHEIPMPVDVLFENTDATGTSATPKAGYSNMILKNGSGQTFKDVQYINFNLPEEDLIVFNGKSYKGNENIYLNLSNIGTTNLQFYYYNEDFLTVQRPMQVKIDAMGVYYDENGNGKVDGWWDADLGIFHSEGDSFVTYLDKMDYEETTFAPVVDADGTVHQYFLRPYYTANPVSLTVPEGHSVDERMQVMPNFITDITGSAAYAALTAEQKAYRTIVSGRTRIGENGREQYSADNHLKYTAEATAYSYVDIPLGGDTSPARPVTYDELKARLTRIAADAEDKKNNTVRYKLDSSIDLIFCDGIGYYYDESAALRLGDAYYVWEPAYKGNLLNDFEQPQLITIANSIAGENIPIAADGTVEYQKEDGTWTEEVPAEGDSSYSVTKAGAYITRLTAKTADAQAKINNYLGSFVDNDTFALVVNEQEMLTDEMLSMDALSVMKKDTKVPQTVTRGAAGLYPNSSYLKQNTSRGSHGEASSQGQGAYSEVEADFMPELFGFTGEAVSILGIETDGYEIALTVGFPFASKDNGGGNGSAANTFDDVKDNWGKITDFCKALKGAGTAKEKTQNAFKGLAGDDLDANKLKSKSIEVSGTLTLAIKLKYNPLDNHYQFSEATIAVGFKLEIRLTARLTVCPILYGYFQFNLEASLATGLGLEREAVTDEANPIFPTVEDVNNINVMQLYEFDHGADGKNYDRADGKNSQFAFLLSNKAFEVRFNGKLYVEYYEFVDKNGNGKLEYGEIGSAAKGYKSGYIEGAGGDAVNVFAKGQSSFDLGETVVVVLSAMDLDETKTNDVTTIASIKAIKDVTSDVYWCGFAFEIEVGIELGVGVGIDIAKIECYFNASIGVAFRLGPYIDGEYEPFLFESFELTLGLGLRVVFLFFNYEQDLISYTLQYEDEGADDGGTWSHSWSALGGAFGGDIGELAVDADGDGTIDARITPPSRLRSKTYTNHVNRAEELETQAFDSHAAEFQVSGYGTSVNAFRLQNNVETGYDYQLVTAGEHNYVVITATDNSAAADVDRTKLMLYRVSEADSNYGLVSPIKASTSSEGVALDGDGTGDLDFTVWAEGSKIHAAWISYAEPQRAPAPQPDDIYAGMTAENYKTAARPYDDPFVIGGVEMTLNNYTTLQLTPVDPPGDEPQRGEFFDAEAQEYDDDAFNAAHDQWVADNNAYLDYLDAQEKFEDWYSYFESYDYFVGQDTAGQLFKAAGNTVVKHAVFDTADEQATGFTGKTVVSGAANGRYDFLPKSDGDVVLYAQSVPYTADAIDSQLNEYSAYIDGLSTGNATTLNNGGMSADYIAASKQSRMDIKEAYLNLYGGNSRLTLVNADGTALTNGEMYVSGHQEGNYAAFAEDATNEILTNLDLAKVGDKYYVSYMTSEDRLIGSSGSYTDEMTISRLYLRSFTVSGNSVEWGEPVLLRQTVNYENDSSRDGVYKKSRLDEAYEDAYMGCLKFLTGRLGNALPDNDEEFEVFDAAAETFLLFEMNGATYVIRESSLASITQPDATGKSHGSINAFFTAEQIYGEEAAEGSNLASGKMDVVIGADGDGNLVAVYTGTVANSTNNAIYMAYWDPETAQWGAGTMLAMNRMDVYEQSILNNWSPTQTQEAYMAPVDEAGTINTFSFSNLQIALGSSSSRQPELDGLSGEAEASALTAQAYAKQLLAENGIEADELSTLDAGDELADVLLALGLGETQNSAPELLILTQGVQTQLVKYVLPRTNISGQYVDENGNVVASADDAAKKTVYAPRTQSEEGGPAEHGNQGVYAISYSKCGQLISNAAIRFAYSEFGEGSRLYANVSFTNVGDAAIRASRQNPVTVELLLNGEGDALATWNIYENIGSGQTVSLSTDEQLCKPLNRDLTTGDFFSIRVSEDRDYIGEGAYVYENRNDATSRFNVESKADLGIEYVKAEITGVDADGNAVADVTFNVTNRGSANAEDVYLQMSYIDRYETVGSEGNDGGQETAVYVPLDLTKSEILVSQQKFITSELETLESPQTDLANGVVRLGTDDRFYTRNYYISAAEYLQARSEYYTLTETTGYIRGEYNGTTYWYPGRYNSAYAAFTAGEEAMKNWKYDSASGSYYNGDYSGMAAAQAAAEAMRKQEYIKTAAQYNALSASEQQFWHVPSDNGSVYVPTRYATYAAALAGYEAAKQAGDDLSESFCRTVNAKLIIDPSLFKGKESGSFDLKLEVFSRSSNASFNADGLYTSAHSDEYYSANNSREVALEEATFIGAAAKINIARGSVHRLPFSVSTTTGKAPELTVLEVEDGADELTTLYYTEDADVDGVPGIMTGYLTIVGAQEGSGVIHITDTATNTTYPIVFQVNAEADGINIYNDDAQFTFYNADNSLFDPAALNQDWRFVTSAGWGDALEEPYLGNLAKGEKGAYFTFETKAGALSFNLIGEVEVSSNVFPGTVRLSGTSADMLSEIDAFNNEENLTHTITVKVVSDEAYLDTVKLEYSAPYTPSDDKEAPGLFWSRSFPTYHSVPDTDTVELTVYAIDETGLQSLNVKVNGTALTAAPVKTTSGLWSMTFTVDKDVESFSAAATDTNGNTTRRDVNVLWFTDNVLAGNEAYGKAPALSGTVVKKTAGGSTEDIYSGIVVYTSEDVLAGSTVEFSYTTEGDAALAYKVYGAEEAAFADNGSAVIPENGIYLVRSENSNTETWSQKVLFVDCFEALPELRAVAADPQFDPNSVKVSWTATKQSTSITRLNRVTVNSDDLTPATGASNAFSGEITLRYGGIYDFVTYDEKNLSGAKRLAVEVPVYDNEAGTYSSNDPWSAPDENGLCGFGTVTVDLNKVTGGSYASGLDQLFSYNNYFGTYEYAIVKAEDMGTEPDQKNFDEDGDYRWLDGLTWTAAAHDDVVTIEDLTAPADGSCEYVVIIRDAQQPANYRTMATEHITLSGNCVVIGSVSSKMASAAYSADGTLYVSAARGDSGLYEFAVLPAAEGTTLTADDFMAEGVQWVGADAAGDGTNAVFDGMATGTYQVAVRALIPEGDAAAKAAQLEVLKANAEAAASAYNTLQQSALQTADAQLRTINDAAIKMADAMTAYKAAEEEYLAAEALLSEGSGKITAAEVDRLKQAFDEANAAQASAKTDTSAELRKAGITGIEAMDLIDERLGLAPGSEELKNFNEALGDKLDALRLADIATELSAALTDKQTTAADYENALAALQAESARSYAADAKLQKGIVVSDPYTIGCGEGTSLTVKTRSNGSNTNPSGAVIITAEGGSAYDGTAPVYQYAVLPLKEGEAPVDYTGNMQAIKDLDLNWQFASDLNESVSQTTIGGLGTGNYQVFVRPVYDPDPRDGFDVMTEIVGSGEDSLKSLEAALRTAEENAQAKVIKAEAAKLKDAAAKAIADGDEQALAQLLAAVENDPAVAAALDAWKNASNSKDSTAAKNQFSEATTAYLTEKAEKAVDDAQRAYDRKVSELNQQIDKAYDDTPGYWQTVSYANAKIAKGGGMPSSAIEGSASDDRQTEFIIDPDKPLSSDDINKIITANEDKTVTLVVDGNTVILPAGTAKKADTVLTAARGVSGGSGNTVAYVDENGQARIAPISMVENGKAVYVFMGGSDYKLATVNSYYTDTVGHWAQESIKFVSDRKLFEGVGDDLFAPANPMTRAMVVTVLHRFAGLPKAEGTNPFSDVSGSTWYSEAVVWAVENGIVEGVSADLFAPDRQVTREQLVTMIARYLKAAGFMGTERGDLDRFTDADQISAYALDSFRWACEAGIIEGSGTSLMPKKQATRAEVAAIFERVVRYILENR